MKTTELRISVAIALLFMTAAAQALQPEVLYAFQLGPMRPSTSLVQGSDGNFYGTTRDGGTGGRGTVFKVTTNGVLTTLVSFNGANGAYPHAGLVLGSDLHFYGTTYSGGSSGGDFGTVFKVTADGALTTLVSFAGTNGAYPVAGLVMGDDGHFYGTTLEGGSGVCNHGGCGTVFQVTANGVLTTLVSFDLSTTGATPSGLALGSDGHFYGTIAGSGTGRWTMFKVATNAVLTVVGVTGDNVGRPVGGLVLGDDANFYGTSIGGSSDDGTVFKVTTNGILTTLVSFTFDNTNGAFPAGLVLGGDGNFYGTMAQGGSSDNGTVFKVTTNGVLTTLVSFTGDDGSHPAGLVLGSDGNFYGMTASGGSSGLGTVFRVTTSGMLTTLLSFANAEGSAPQAGLTLGSDGHFYGTTSEGGVSGVGTVFQLTANGVLTTLVSFNHTNGARPLAALVLGNDGHFYGTTSGGGSNYNQYGTVFKVTTNGVLTSLVSFDGHNGSYPQAGLVLGRDGNLYGTTPSGGTIGQGSLSDYGTVFKVTTNGVLTTLVSFTGTNGARPLAALVLGNDGNFYGTTEHGGNGFGGPGWSGSGTVFKLTTNGVLTTLVSFNNDNGAFPQAALLGRDGYFYGTTSGGVISDLNGTVFKLTTDGVLTSLVSFTGNEFDPKHPSSALVLGNDGAFYGTTSHGDKYAATVFRVTTNGVLTSLVSFPAGQSVGGDLILGRDGNLYGTTSTGGPGGGGTIFRLVISAFSSVARQPDGSLLLTGTGPFNGSYRLWASADLSLPVASWTLLTSATFDNAGNFTFTDAGAATNSSRFYQLSVP